eukprot:GHVP01069134.1.p1 GENE.GHVP01069134.1~~GHVP01069134.1.p1  ORF type:complete len:525 (+),score=84.18 GHVP01069134.1:825-2399(+)
MASDGMATWTVSTLRVGSSLVEIENSTPRAAHTCIPCRNLLIFFGGWNGKEVSNDLSFYIPATNSWRQLRPQNRPPPRNNHAAAIIQTKMFIHGGHSGTKWLGDFWCLELGPFIDRYTEDSDEMEDPHGEISLEWSRIEPQCDSHTPRVPSPRACHSMVCVDSKLIIFGGYDGTKCFCDIDVFDPTKNEWKNFPESRDFGSPRNAHSAMEIEDGFLVFGGHNGDLHLNDVWEFNLPKCKWTQRKVHGLRPPGLRGHSATLYGKTMIVFGGFDGYLRGLGLHVFDLEDNHWSFLAAENLGMKGRQRHTANFVSPNLLFIHGGFDGQSWLGNGITVDLECVRLALAQSLFSIEKFNFSSLYGSTLFSDVKIKLGETELSAHRAVLYSKCDYFRSLFNSSMKETKEGCVSLPFSSTEIAELILKFLYGVPVRGIPTTLKDLAALIEATDLLGMDVLKEVAEEAILQRYVNEQDLINLIQQVKNLPVPNVRKAAAKLIASNVKLQRQVIEEIGDEAPEFLYEMLKPRN